jgi:hypothetical protein
VSVAALPLSVRRHYTVRDLSHSWQLRCLYCSAGFELGKPRRTEEVKPGNLLRLLEHTRSHDVAVAP